MSFFAKKKKIYYNLNSFYSSQSLCFYCDDLSLEFWILILSYFTWLSDDYGRKWNHIFFKNFFFSLDGINWPCYWFLFHSTLLYKMFWLVWYGIWDIDIDLQLFIIRKLLVIILRIKFLCQEKYLEAQFFLPWKMGHHFINNCYNFEILSVYWIFCWSLCLLW